MDVNTAKLSRRNEALEYTDDMGLGERIKALRERKGWSQGALARAAGISQPTIAKLESDPRRTTTRLPEIARALDVDPSELDPRYAKRPKPSPAEDKLSSRSADIWDRLTFAAVDEAFRVAGFQAEVSARIAAEILTAIDAPLRVPPGMTDAEVVRRLVRWELPAILESARR